MIDLQSKQYIRFLLAMAWALLFAVITAVFLIENGKTQAFTSINHLNHPVTDFFFKYYTYLGDGVVWVLLGLICLLFKRQWILPVLFAIVISTTLIHILKRVVFPEDLRPLSLQTKGIYVHTVEGVQTHMRNSFPSGHAGQAFTMALLLVYLLGKKWAVFLLPFAAFGVAYSRVYLAQHFVGDVLAGTFIGILSSWLAIIISLQIRKKKSRKQFVNKN